MQQKYVYNESTFLIKKKTFNESKFTVNLRWKSHEKSFDLSSTNVFLRLGLATALYGEAMPGNVAW